MLDVIVQCDKCKHLSFDYIYPTCKAFPDGIPNELFSEEISHTKPYKNDNGIQFEAKEK